MGVEEDLLVTIVNYYKTILIVVIYISDIFHIGSGRCPINSARNLLPRHDFRKTHIGCNDTEITLHT